MDTRQLIKQCLKGNEQAQKQLYDLFAASMLGVCYRYTKNRDDAQDILQEGFIKVFKNLDKYRGDGELGGWIRRIMVNTALEFLKRHQHYQSDMMLQNENLHPVTDDHAVINLNVKDIIVLIRQLPSGYQTIFNLHAIEGYSHVEIAKMMGISEGTSRSQYMRARNLLRDWMENYTNEQKLNSYA